MSHHLMSRCCPYAPLVLALSVSVSTHASTPNQSPTSACQVTDVGSFVTDFPPTDFGTSVAIDGVIAVVGAPEESSVEVGGAAYIYRWNGTAWTEEQKLTGPVWGQFDDPSYFGASVAIDGDVILVGASIEPCAAGWLCGAAYAYRWNGNEWIQEQKIVASDAAAYDEFGWSVSMSGDVAVVGSTFGAYVFRWNGTMWQEEQQFTGGEVPLDWLGFSVSVSDTAILVGGPLRDCEAGSNCGVVYSYRWNGALWVEEQVLTPTAAAPEQDAFGTSVFLTGDSAMVGSPGDHCEEGAAPCNGSVSVYRYHGTVWQLQQKLVAADAVDGASGLGDSVTFGDKLALVGAGGDDCPTGVGCGSAYVFAWNGTAWIEQTKITRPDAAEYDTFGDSVAISDTMGVIGAPGFNGLGCEPGDFCGAAFMYDLNDCQIQEPVPTLSEWGIITMMTVMLGAGAIIIGRKRKAIG